MHLYEVIIRDNHNGKKFLYHVYASGNGTATHEARVAHKNATGSSGDPVKITRID